MNREFYQSLNEAYASMYTENSIKRGYEGTKNQDAESLGKGIKDAATEYGETVKDYSRGLFQGKKISSKAPTHARVINAWGRAGNKLGGGTLNNVGKLAVQGGKNAYNIGKWAGKQLEPAVKTAADKGGQALGWLGKKSQGLIKGLTKEDVQFCVGAYLLDSGLAVTPQNASAIVEHMTDEYLEHMLDQIPEESFNELTEALGISDAALEAAAAATQKKHKEQGMKIHSTQGVKDLFKIGNKKGQV